MFFNLFKKQPEPDKGGEPEAPDLSAAAFFEAPAEEPPAPPPEPVRPKAIHLPAALRTGLSVKLAPERQPSTPRTWDSRILRTDDEGLWVTQDKGPDSFEARVGDTMTVVTQEGGQRQIYDCKVARIEHTSGNNRPNEVLLEPPAGATRSNTASGQGKRKHLRIHADLPGECREVKEAELGPPLTIHTINVSLSGLAFRCNKSFDSARELEIKLLAWKFPLHIRATVVRSTRQNDGTYLVAIHFPPEISPITRDLISQFILDNQRR